MECAICHSTYSLKGLVTHLRRAHNLSVQQYYDSFIDITHEQVVCVVCGKPTKFASLTRGYHIYCSNLCMSRDPQTDIKRRNTCKTRYGDDTYRNPEKQRMSSLGIKKSEKHVANIKLAWTTNKEDRLQKVRDSKFKNHGDSNYNNRVQYIQTMVTTYGVKNPSQDLEIHKKQNKNIHTAFQLKDYVTKFNDNISYQSNLELKYIKECESNDIRIMDGDVVDYTYNGTNSKYFVDFKIEKDGIIDLVEIKARHMWFERDMQNGLMEAKVKAAMQFVVEQKYNSYKFVLETVEVDILKLIANIGDKKE